MKNEKNTYVGEVVGAILSTREYSAFKQMKGNRDVLEDRKSRVRSSIKEHGWIRNPIIVNEKMEILEGQARFEVLKELGMPIEYIVAESATINDCITLNVKRKNWKMYDYIQSFASMGNPEYIFLMDQLKKYRGKVPDSVIIHLTGSMKNDAIPSNMINEGKFHADDKQTVDKRMSFIMDMFSIIGKNRGRTRLWGNVFKFVYYSNMIDNNQMKNALTKYIAEVTPAVTTQQALDSMEKIYNRGRHGEKVYFMPEYDKYCRGI